jgi:hypothetical protein
MKSAATALLVAAALAGVPAAPAGAGAIEEVALGAGLFGVLDDDPAAQLDAELRFPSFFAIPRTGGRFTLAPVAGAMANADGGVYAWGGFRLDLPLGARWVVAPYTGAGIYRRGDGAELGGPLEFRSGLEASYRIGPRSRLGLSFYHLSNARIYDVNPGTESLVLVYSYRPGR